MLDCPSPGVDQGLQEKGRIWETEHRFSVLHWLILSFGQLEHVPKYREDCPLHEIVLRKEESRPWVGVLLGSFI